MYEKLFGIFSQIYKEMSVIQNFKKVKHLKRNKRYIICNIARQSVSSNWETNLSNFII